MNDIESRFGHLKEQYGLNRKSKVTDLPPKVLAKILTTDELAELVATRYFGGHFEALKMVDLKRFREVDHGQWDLTLSFLAKERRCGLPNQKGACPFPFEKNMKWWLSVRTDLRKAF